MKVKTHKKNKKNKNKKNKIKLSKKSKYNLSGGCSPIVRIDDNTYADESGCVFRNIQKIAKITEDSENKNKPLYFYFIKLTNDNYRFWWDFKEYNQKLIKQHVSGVNTFEKNLQLFRNQEFTGSGNEIWISFSSITKFTNINFSFEKDIELAFCVFFNNNSPITTHMGIFRTFEFNNHQNNGKRVQITPDLAIDLHIFAVQATLKLCKDRNIQPKKYMLTKPVDIMIDILKKAFITELKLTNSIFIGNEVERLELSEFKKDFFYPEGDGSNFPIILSENIELIIERITKILSSKPNFIKNSDNSLNIINYNYKTLLIILNEYLNEQKINISDNAKTAVITMIQINFLNTSRLNKLLNDTMKCSILRMLDSNKYLITKIKEKITIRDLYKKSIIDAVFYDIESSGYKLYKDLKSKLKSKLNFIDTDKKLIEEEFDTPYWVTHHPDMQITFLLSFALKLENTEQLWIDAPTYKSD